MFWLWISGWVLGEWAYSWDSHSFAMITVRPTLNKNTELGCHSDAYFSQNRLLWIASTGAWGGLCGVLGFLSRTFHLAFCMRAESVSRGTKLDVQRWKMTSLLISHHVLNKDVEDGYMLEKYTIDGTYLSLIEGGLPTG